MLKHVETKKDMFNRAIPGMNTMKQYFESTGEISKSLKNIALFNETRNDVPKHIGKLQNKEAENEVSEFSIRRKYCKAKDTSFNMNLNMQL